MLKNVNKYLHKIASLSVFQITLFNVRFFILSLLIGIMYLVYTQNFPKNEYFLPARNLSVSENFAYVLNEWSHIVSFREFPN